VQVTGKNHSVLHKLTNKQQQSNIADDAKVVILNSDAKDMNPYQRN